VKEPWNRLFGADVCECEADVYGQTVKEGGVVTSLRVPESEVAHARAVLDIHRPVDVARNLDAKISPFSINPWGRGAWTALPPAVR
jgi:hypothetical protein